MALKLRVLPRFPRDITAGAGITITTVGGDKQIALTGGGPVTSFKTRTGAVVPAADDYAVADITGLQSALTGLFKVLNADVAGTDVNTAQPWFPAAGAVTLAVGTYLFSGQLWLSRAAGANSHTTSVLFGGTATLGSILYIAECNTGDAVSSAAQNSALHNAATAIVVKAASTSTTEQILLRVTGVVRVTVTGTLIPQFQYSAAPGGAPTVKANSYFRLQSISTSATATENGTWA